MNRKLYTINTMASKFKHITTNKSKIMTTCATRNSTNRKQQITDPTNSMEEETISYSQPKITTNMTSTDISNSNTKFTGTPTSSTIQIKKHTTIDSFRKARHEQLPFLTNPQTTLGLVPTMGALHDGHLSLMKRAREENDVVVASIYVNPTQFGKGEDLDKYPRSLERDIQLLDDLGVDHVFTPENMYDTHHVTYVDPMGFDNIAEGRERPGHFRGVATIVTKLLNIIQPTNAYFGQKDAAQCVLIRRIVHDLNINTNIHVVSTMREDDGLAMSSRNVYLNKDEREAATVLYKSLCAGKDLFESKMLQKDNNHDGEAHNVSANLIRQSVISMLQSEPMVKDIQYVSIDSKETMKPLEVVDKDGAIVSIACKVGSVRLIDNFIL